MNNSDREEIIASEETKDSGTEELLAEATPFREETIKYEVTEEEYLRCFQAIDKCRGRLVRQIIQTVILAVVAGYSIVCFATFGMKEARALFVGAAAIVVIAFIWIMAPIRRRHMAEIQKDHDRPHTVTVGKDEIIFGSGDDQAPFRYQGSKATIFPDMLIFWLSRDGFVCLPRRIFKPDVWNYLASKFMK